MRKVSAALHGSRIDSAYQPAGGTRGGAAARTGCRMRQPPTLYVLRLALASALGPPVGSRRGAAARTGCRAFPSMGSHERARDRTAPPVGNRGGATARTGCRARRASAPLYGFSLDAVRPLVRSRSDPG